MTKSKKIKIIVLTGIAGIASVFFSWFKRPYVSDEQNTPQHKTTEYNIKESNSTKHVVFLPNTDHKKPTKSIENQQPKKTPYRISTKSYTINGKTYYPMATADGFTETGFASWYGPRFHGKKTASGDIYDQNKHTAAHKTLPFGTRVRVENPANHTYTIVEITDRGPFVDEDDRIIDLSYAAAKELGLVQQGVGPVILTVIKDEEPTITPDQKIDEIAALKDTIDSTKLRVISDSVQRSK